MPFIDVTLVEGRTPEQLRALITALTDATETSLSTPRQGIRVALHEVPPTHWAAGGETIVERRAREAAERNQ